MGQAFHESMMHPRARTMSQHEQPSRMVGTQEQRCDVAHFFRYMHCEFTSQMIDASWIGTFHLYAWSSLQHL